MNIKEFTESAIALYLAHGGSVNPDITLDIFKMIQSNEYGLGDDYEALKEDYKDVNPTIGKTIRQHFDLRNDKVIVVSDKECKLLETYTRFHKK